MRCRPIPFGVFLTLAFAGFAVAQPRQRAGLEKLSVAALKSLAPISMAAFVDKACSAFGLDADTVKRDIEVKLRVSGIAMVETGNALEVLWLTLAAMAYPPAKVQHLTFNLLLLPLSWLRRPYPQRLELFGPATQVLGTCPTQTCREFIRRDVRDDVDQFINDYLTANPKQ